MLLVPNLTLKSDKIFILNYSHIIFYFPALLILKKEFQKKKNPERFYLKAKIWRITQNNDFVYFSIITQLINNTKDTINYASWSCSWEDNYNINNDQIIVDRPGCDKNDVKVITIFPDSSDVKHVLNCKILWSDSLRIP